MERRGFLKLFGVGAITAASSLILPPDLQAAAGDFDPEKALWIPGQKTFFLPPAPKIEQVAAGKLQALAEQQRRARVYGEFDLTEAQRYAKRGLLSDDVVTTYWSHQAQSLVTERNIVQNGIITGIEVRPLSTQNKFRPNRPHSKHPWGEY